MRFACEGKAAAVKPKHELIENVLHVTGVRGILYVKTLPCKGRGFACKGIEEEDG
jgi:hypothetical protein